MWAESILWCEAFDWRKLPTVREGRELPGGNYRGKIPRTALHAQPRFRYRLRLLQRAESAMASEEPQAKKQKLSEEEEEQEKEEKTDEPAKLRWQRKL